MERVLQIKHLFPSKISFLPNPLFLLLSFIFRFVIILGTHSLEKEATCNFIAKETMAQMFSCGFCETDNLFTEQLWATVSVCCFNILKISTFLGKNVSRIKLSSPGSI